MEILLHIYAMMKSSMEKLLKRAEIARVHVDQKLIIQMRILAALLFERLLAIANKIGKVLIQENKISAG